MRNGADDSLCGSARDLRVFMLTPRGSFTHSAQQNVDHRVRVLYRVRCVRHEELTRFWRVKISKSVATGQLNQLMLELAASGHVNQSMKGNRALHLRARL